MASSWFIFNEEDTLVPLKVDISYRGARYVDSFCWNCNPKSNTMSPYEFACRTCADVGLPDGFQWKIALEIQEQVDAFRILLDALQSNSINVSNLFSPLQKINLGIRYNTIDYTDKFTLDFGTKIAYAPEYFAKITAMNLGLPCEMVPVIAHNIRESIYRVILHAIESGAADKPIEESSLTPSEVNINIVAPNLATEMITNLWKRAKPNNFDDQTYIPQPKLPAVSDSNAHVWLKK